jgi:hypothetical protein
VCSYMIHNDDKLCSVLFKLEKYVGYQYELNLYFQMLKYIFLILSASFAETFCPFFFNSVFCPISI